MNIQAILKQYWGYDSFRPMQTEIIQSILDEKDTLALLPTGGGKSICFQVPAMAKNGICLVVSPLIALMRDQVENLKKRGIKALLLSSGMRHREIDILLDNAVYGDYKFLYVSPERLETELFRERFKKMPVSFIAVDEAHCISQWGYDFRPSYLNIAQLREIKGDLPIIALTATATPKVVQDIQEQLQFRQSNVFQKSFERKNLAYVVLAEEDPYRRMLKVMEGVPGSGIIYVKSRKRTKEVSNYLNDAGIRSEYYHGGLNHEERNERQERWINNQSRVMVATNAFGMGIDKADVRFVIHLDLPETLEAYFQEAGRGGRDGKKSYAVLMYQAAMAQELRQRMEKSYPDIPTIKKCYQALANFLQIPIGGGEGQSYALDVAELSERYQLKSNTIIRSLKFLEKEGYLSLSDALFLPSRIHLKMGKDLLYQFQISHPHFDAFIKLLLRSYSGLFEAYVRIDERELAKRAKASRAQIVKYLEQLVEREVLSYLPQNNLPQLTFLTERLETNAIRLSKRNYEERKKISFQKMEAVIRYVNSNHRCRSRLLLDYFGEREHYPCGQCDVCLSRNKMRLSQEAFSEIETQIRQFLQKETCSFSKVVESVKGYPKEKVLEVVDFLLDNGQIRWEGQEIALI